MWFSQKKRLETLVISHLSTKIQMNEFDFCQKKTPKLHFFHDFVPP